MANVNNQATAGNKEIHPWTAWPVRLFFLLITIAATIYYHHGNYAKKMQMCFQLGGKVKNSVISPYKTASSFSKQCLVQMFLIP